MDPIVIPEAYAESSFASEGFADQDAMFAKMGEMQSTIDAPISVPEAHKEKGWAGKEFKTTDDLYNEISDLNELKGKKTVAFDYATATENEITEYIKSGAPEDSSEYDFGVRQDAEGNPVKDAEGNDVQEFDDSEREWMGKVLKDAGTDAHKAKILIKGLAEQRREVMTKSFSAERQEEILKESFETEGDWKQIAGEMANSIKGNLNEKDQALLTTANNDLLGLIYRLQRNTTKAYGIEEGQHRGGSGGGDVSGEGIEAQRLEIRTKMDAIRGKQGTHDELNRLNKELQDTYKNDSRLSK
ncbi:MAG: hypothetical protein ACTSXE_00780 [Candidatus Thorarchaeota archaeon]